MEAESAYPIYLDYQSTTPVDPRVLEVMLPYLTDVFGNPASKTHRHGHDALSAIENSRKQIAKVIKAKPQEIVFTSGATEAINMAIKGIAFANIGKGGHFITVATEHKAVLDCHTWLESNGFEVTVLPVDTLGMLDPSHVAQAIKPNTLLVSVMIANNEIGVIQPVSEIGKICREHEVYFFTDATQAFGKVPLDVNTDSIDMLCASAHKIYGPKGVGMLYVRRSNPRVKLEPIIHGGGHEAGLRSGTLATHQIVGLGESAILANNQIQTSSIKTSKLLNLFCDILNSEIGDISYNGDQSHKIPGVVNFTIDSVNAEALIASVSHIISISSGSACTSREVIPSHVLRAIGLSESSARESIRLSFGRFSEEMHASIAAKEIARSAKRLLRFSKLH